MFARINGQRRRWVFIYSRESRSHELGIGSMRDVTLARARERAADFRRELAEGRDPRSLRVAVVAPTFGEAANAYIADVAGPTISHIQTLRHWKRTLGKDAAKLRPLRVDRIGVEDVLDVLKPIWSRKDTAKKLRSRIERVLDFAVVKGWREAGANPAAWQGNLVEALPKRERKGEDTGAKHYEAMPFADVPAFMDRLRAKDGIAERALEFAILTAARTGEVIGADWKEIDVDRGLWTIPAHRMKSNREHRVPLAPRAIAMLRGLPHIGSHVFPGEKRHASMAHSRLLLALRAMGVTGSTPHGFRSSFRDWVAEETDYPHELAELSLAHSVGDTVVRAYLRGDGLRKRRELMNAWETYCNADG
ncbi:putative prophage CPS-53 integrase [Variibacter gotjawalensis]|uniref:Putative prophage CPS-53 integrase n=1 Tax=Variibacter gotjawalensis TaxID=1333996 RepID=A0A0S3PXE2_9BRAD|nr:site-specific integrase [Variibacter gotjawalensis]NIK46452.1 integrase [Variibacter gotjawalensis]RZS48362.1 integrase [Variibacter gotjawalensis]BAT60620.1 putative prophage CPS-53 integrase [Variibacter gotjawalensis]